MPTFTDTRDRCWTVEINVSAVKRVKSLTGVDLLDVAEGGMLAELATDPVRLCDVLYALCRPEAEARGVSDEAFGEGLAGDAIERATGALLGALIGFFPNPRDRGILQTALAKVEAAKDVARTRVEAELESGRIERQVEAKLAELGLPGPRSTSSPASSGSIPDH